MRQAKVRPEPHAANHAIDRGWLASARHDLAAVGAPWSASRPLRATYEAMISDLGSRDAQLLYVPTGTPLRLKNRPARLTVRAIRRPEPDIWLLVRASLEYYNQLQQDQDL